MKLIAKKGADTGTNENEKDPGPVHFPWDAALAALNSGAYDVHGEPRGERGPDQPGAQTPAPGVDPVGGKEEAAPNSPLTNLTPSTTGSNAPGLPKEPESVKTEVTKAPQMAGPAVPAAPVVRTDGKPVGK